ncbi:dihydrofolate reductase family protein [Xylanimonas sp. McL0601]|uniref:dihydrofolate reductase family protein n=1 Tax=Xylanimonas sp. McL0601 TaxID=3414739 RepID=UPI003CED6C19
MSVIVIQFISVDGIVTDPDGTDGTPTGGWAFRHGRETVAGDKFRLGTALDDGALLLGRRTWEHFAGLWPYRDDPFSQRMNAASKLVASHTLTDVSAWAGSQLVKGEVVDAVRREPRDVVVAGSVSVVRQLQDADLVDEYRLLTFPTVLGSGERLFPEGFPRTFLTTISAEQGGAPVLTCYRRDSEPQASSRG